MTTANIDTAESSAPVATTATTEPDNVVTEESENPEENVSR